MAGAAAAPDDTSLAGYYAGVVTRFATGLTDLLVSSGVFALGFAFVDWFTRRFFDVELSLKDSPIGGIALLVWLFTYYWYCWSLSGKTPACALFGVRVVRSDGSELDSRHAAVRTVAYPFSFLFFGLGFVGLVLGRQRRAFHDVVANSAVVYDWDARAARLRFLARHKPETAAPTDTPAARVPDTRSTPKSGESRS